MKPKTIFILLAIFLSTGLPQLAIASEKDDPKSVSTETASQARHQARLEEIRNRVSEIKAMDKSGLSRSERKALRKELREMNKEARVMKGGVYLSVGAIIIIILVLILIL